MTFKLLGRNTETRRSNWRWAGLLAALVAGLLAFAACGDTSTPTTSPTAAPTSTPMAEPTPTATPVPTPTATAVPTSAPEIMSLSDLDGASTGAQLIAALSDSEADCLRSTIGDEGYEALQGLTLTQIPAGFDTFPMHCLEPANAIDLSVAMMSIQAGGLSDDSSDCIKDVFDELGLPSENMTEEDSLRSVMFMQLCLTDEEARALDISGGEDLFPTPSQLRCISGHTDLENLFVLQQVLADLGASDAEPSPEALAAIAEIIAAYEACGIPAVIPGDGS